MRLILLFLLACGGPRTQQPVPQASHEAKAGAPVRLTASTVETGKNTIVVELLGPVDGLDLVARLGGNELARHAWTEPLKAGDTVELDVDVPEVGSTPLLAISALCNVDGHAESRVMALDVKGMRVESATQAPVRTDPHGRPIRPAE